MYATDVELKILKILNKMVIWQNFASNQYLNSKNTTFERKLTEDGEILLIVKTSRTFGAKCARKW